MRTLSILAIFMIVTVFACTKDEPIGENEYVTLSYKQTSCSDPWMNTSSDSLTLVNVANYLNGVQLYFASLNIKLDGPIELCLACPCKTGRTIFVSTLNSDSLKARYERIGFK